MYPLSLYPQHYLRETKAAWDLCKELQNYTNLEKRCYWCVFLAVLNILLSPNPGGAWVGVGFMILSWRRGPCSEGVLGKTFWYPSGQDSLQEVKLQQ